MIKQSTKYLKDKPHLKITFYFLVFGYLWILLSDRALNYLFPDIQQAYLFQTYKGWFFVSITGILIFVTSKNHFKESLDLAVNLRKSQVLLSERNFFIESVLNKLPIGVAVSNKTSDKSIYMNDKFEEVYGWPLKNVNLDDFFTTVFPDPDYRRRIREMVQKDITSGEAEKMVWDNIHINTKAGKHRIIKAMNISIPELEIMVSLVDDVTESKKNERQVLDSRNRYRAIFENSPVPLWEGDFSLIRNYFKNLKKTGHDDIENYLNNKPEELKHIANLIKIIDVNKAMLSLFKAVDKHQIEKRTIYPETDEAYENLKKQIICLYKGDSQIEYTLKNYDLSGKKLFVRSRLVIIPGHEEDFSNILVSITDITDITLIQKTLEDEKHKADIAIDSSGMGYWEVDFATNTNRINENWAKMLGYEKNDIEETYTQFTSLVHPDDLHEIENAKNQSGNQINLEVRLKSKNNKWKWVSINGVIRERDHEGSALRALGTHRDLSFEREKEKVLLSSYIEGEDRERKRIAGELHDSLGQSLTAASLSFNSVWGEIKNKNTREQMSTGIFHLDEAISETRNISHNLLPRTLEDFGLIPGIKNLVSSLQRSTRITIFLFENIGKIKLEHEKELNIYRIIQEALNNCIKHSECSRIDLQLIRHGSTLTISIEDNGKGFNFKETEKLTTGFGLRNIRIRTKAMSADLIVESRQGGGTSLIIEMEIQ
jgi:PAS domain S-box-containing protein